MTDNAVDRALRDGRFELVAFLVMAACTGALFGLAVLLWAKLDIVLAVPLTVAAVGALLPDYMLWVLYRDEAVR